MEIETVKPPKQVSKPAKIPKIKFELERLPPLRGRHKTTSYSMTELKHLAEQIGVKYVRNKFFLVKNLLAVFLDMKKIPPGEQKYGVGNYYSESEMDTLFKALGVTQKKYEQKLSALKKKLT